MLFDLIVPDNRQPGGIKVGLNYPINSKNIRIS